MGENKYDETKDTSWLDMDATFPPHFHEQPQFFEAASQPEWKDMVQAPVPFIYDIQEDTITIGQPGERHSAIPGQFTPGGIVEGTYEPGGKVHIRSMTNMPYTVRHMLELWYYNNPQMEIKSVDLTDDEGKQTKLAGEGQDIGGYINSMVAAHPTTWHAYKALEAAGGRVYVVGGAVRDALLGKEPNDFDLMCTGLSTDEMSRVLNALVKQKRGRSVDVTGKDFGVLRYKEGPYDEVEIALPRRERATGGGGHKDFMVDADHTMTPEEDLYRRDFTINAMAVDLQTGQLVDPFHGLDDIKTRTLRTLNTKSLADDPLRTLRALTAVAKHGVLPHADTEDQMIENGPGLMKLPNDRIKSELDKMFGYDFQGDHKAVDTVKAMRLAMDTGLMKYVLPEVEAARDYDQSNPHHEQMLDQHLLSVLEHMQKLAPNDPDLKLAALLHDIGKPASRWSECRDCFKAHPGEVHNCESCGSNNVSGHFYRKEPGIGENHEDVGAEMAKKRLTDLRYSNDRIKRVSELIQHHMFPAFNTEKGARRFLNRMGDHSDDLLKLRQADQGGKSVYPTDPTMSVDDHQKLVDKVRAGNAPTALSQLAVNGNDLIQAGVPQGPAIGQNLQWLQEQVLENPQLNTKDALLGLLRGRTANWDPAPEQFESRFPMNTGTHRLNWQPGGWGKGIRDYDGNWHTWNVSSQDGTPIHDYYQDMAEQAGHSFGPDRYEERFHIHPNGYVATYGAYDDYRPFKYSHELESMDSTYHTNRMAPSAPPMEMEDLDDLWRD